MIDYYEWYQQTSCYEPPIKEVGKSIEVAKLKVEKPANQGLAGRPEGTAELMMVQLDASNSTANRPAQGMTIPVAQPDPPNGKKQRRSNEEATVCIL